MFKRPDEDFFSSIECPEIKAGKLCLVINCIFAHDLVSSNLKRSAIVDLAGNTLKQRKTVPDAKNTSAGLIETILDNPKPTVVTGSSKVASSAPPSPIVVRDHKNANHSNNTSDDEDFIVLPREITHLNISHEQRCRSVRMICEFYEAQESNERSKSEADAIVEEHRIANNSDTEVQYSENIKRFLDNEPIAEKTDPQFIMPREVGIKAPATLPQRKHFIELLVAAHKSHNPEIRLPITLSISQEHEVASTNSSATYVQAIKKCIYYATHPEKIKSATKKSPSPAETWSALQKLVITPDILRKFGYTMDLPPMVVPNPKRTCLRCGAEFALYDSSLPKPIRCQFHEGKLRRKNKTTRAYDCCGVEQGTDSDPCQSCDHHVFKWENAEERHAALPYYHTKDLFDADSYVLSKCLGIDCEMGYTTQGFELLRISAIDFMSGRDVLDILVKPKGIVIDLNTRYSGVDKIEQRALSFEKLMEVLGKHMNSNTILVGHGLENDMNAMRLIHEKIVDTAILYPKFKATPTFRYSLKDLAFTFLSRNIQGGEHDSREDSIAAIDIVKHFIARDAELQLK